MTQSAAKFAEKTGAISYEYMLYIEDSDMRYDDGVHLLYFNTAVDNMCKAVEEFAKEYGIVQWNKGNTEGKIEAVKNMLKTGLDIETALSYAGIDRRTYDEYEKLQ